MSIINGIMNVLFDVLLFPFRAMPPLVGLLFLSVLLGVVFLLLFKYTSPQKTIKKVKDRIKAGLYEVRLYKDDLGVIFRANKGLMINNARYIGCCLVPLVPMVILILPILFQLDARYGILPLGEGETTLLEVHLAEQVDFDSAVVALAVPDGLKVEAGPMRIPSKREYAYRIKAEKAGHYELRFIVNGESYTKSVDADEDIGMVSPKRMQSSIYALQYPGESPWPAGSRLESMELRHVRKGMLGMDGDYFPWLIIFCIVAIAAGFAMKGIFKVNI
jgi:hypothetical protein